MKTQTKINKSEIGYIGSVQDRMTEGDAAVLYTSRVCSTWGQAYERAHAAAKRLGYGERAEILITTPDGEAC